MCFAGSFCGTETYAAGSRGNGKASSVSVSAGKGKSARKKNAAKKNTGKKNTGKKKNAAKQSGQKMTQGQKNALAAATDYISVLPLSEQGLTSQLKHDGYTGSDVSFAEKNCGADRNAEAEEAAKG